MKIAEHTERDNNRRTFYSLEYGDVFVLEDNDDEYYLKLNGIYNPSGLSDGTVFNAVSLTKNILRTFNGGTNCYRVDAELIVNNKYKYFLKK